MKLQFLTASYVLFFSGISYSDAGFLESLEKKKLSESNAKLPKYVNEFRYGSDRKRILSAFALGVYHLNHKRPQLALQYLATAKTLADDQNPILHPISFNRARAYYALGDYQKSQKISKTLLKVENEHQHEAYRLLLESLRHLGLDKEFIQAFRQYRKNFAKRYRKASILELGAKYFASSADKENHFELLEELAEKYPLTASSRWAFELLNQHHCQNNYVFSLSVLKKVGINRVLDESIGDFIFAQIDKGKIRINHQEKQLSFEDKVSILIDLRLSSLAKKHYLSSLENRALSSNGNKRLEYLKLLANLHDDTFDYERSVFYYHLALKEFPEHRDNFRIRENLAYALANMNAHGSAAEIFEKLASSLPSRRLRWQHFWNTYRAGEYETALELLDQKNYVFAKDSNEPLGTSYWRARILEKLGQREKALKVYENILRSDGESFYANLVLFRHPQLWDETIQHRDDGPKQLQTNLNLNHSPLLASADTGHSSELQRIYDYLHVGLRKSARNELARIPLKQLTPDEQKTLKQIAARVYDFRFPKRFVLQVFKGFNQYPQDLYSLINHQERYNTAWQALYPFAYEELLTKITKRYNIDSFLLLSVMRAESRYNPYAQSWVGARGLMQIMPKTALKIAESLNHFDFEIDDLYQPAVNLTFGAAYLRKLMRYYDENPFVALSAYNAGPFAANMWLDRCRGCEIDEYVETISYRETRRYVKEVIRYFALYSRIYNQTQPMSVLPNLPTSLPKNEDLF